MATYDLLIKNGTIVDGTRIPAYHLEKLRVLPMETLYDLPDGDWRRVQKADGYCYTIVNGEITFEGQKCTGALPGKVLRSYDMAG
jgi:N-acyl-D-amino-acid deacylase